MTKPKTNSTPSNTLPPANKVLGPVFNVGKANGCGGCVVGLTVATASGDGRLLGDVAARSVMTGVASVAVASVAVVGGESVIGKRDDTWKDAWARCVAVVMIEPNLIRAIVKNRHPTSNSCDRS